MPTLIYNIDNEIGFEEGDSQYTPFSNQFRENFIWQITPGQFGLLVGKASDDRVGLVGIFILNVPKGADIRRVTFELTAKTNSVGVDPYRVSILDPQPSHSQPVSTEDGLHGVDANWLVKDITRNTPFVWSDFEAIGAVYDDVPVNTNDGGSVQGFGGQNDMLTDDGIGTFGIAWTATSDYTLGEIRLRISRNNGINDTDSPTTSRSGLNLRVEIYNVISSTDRRPLGSPIATSNTVSWDSLKIGATPGNNQNTWAIFTFTSGPSIVDGSIHVYKLVVDGGGVLPLNSPYIRSAFDGGFTTSAGQLSTASTNAAAGVYWGAGGFTFSAYPHVTGFPNASENAEGGFLVAGRVFANDQCIVDANGSIFETDVLHVWGHDLDRPGFGINTVLDGSGSSVSGGSSTIDLVGLFQKWIDDPLYSPNGTRTALILDPTTIISNKNDEFAMQEDPTDPGFVLRITFARRIYIT